ncbi:carboxymuconolactone decarboxylase family protein [Flavobacteriaceae sp. LMIT009]
MADLVEEFNAYRERMNDNILADNNKIIKRIFNLDTNAFQAGALDKKTKELLGLVASMVLRCDDCVKYHLGTCHEIGITKEEVAEALSIATLVGGTIVIPHLRRAYEYWDTLDQQVK